jgi:hypothetical protein
MRDERRGRKDGDAVSLVQVAQAAGYDARDAVHLSGVWRGKVSSAFAEDRSMTTHAVNEKSHMRLGRNEPERNCLNTGSRKRRMKMKKKKSVSKKKYVIVRTYSAGVFAGYIESRKGKEVVMTEARRLWYWKGASSLSQLAMEGVKCPLECKFPVAMDRVELTEVIEIIDVTPAAKASIDGVPVWKQ